VNCGRRMICGGPTQRFLSFIQARSPSYDFCAFAVRRRSRGRRAMQRGPSSSENHSSRLFDDLVAVPSRLLSYPVAFVLAVYGLSLSLLALVYPVSDPRRSLDDLQPRPHHRRLVAETTQHHHHRQIVRPRELGCIDESASVSTPTLSSSSGPSPSVSVDDVASLADFMPTVDAASSSSSCSASWPMRKTESPERYSLPPIEARPSGAAVDGSVVAPVNNNDVESKRTRRLSPVPLWPRTLTRRQTSPQPKGKGKGKERCKDLVGSGESSNGDNGDRRSTSLDLSPSSSASTTHGQGALRPTRAQTTALPPSPPPSLRPKFLSFRRRSSNNSQSFVLDQPAGVTPPAQSPSASTTATTSSSSNAPSPTFPPTSPGSSMSSSSSSYSYFTRAVPPLVAPGRSKQRPATASAMAATPRPPRPARQVRPLSAGSSLEVPPSSSSSSSTYSAAASGRPDPSGNSGLSLLDFEPVLQKPPPPRPRRSEGFVYLLVLQIGFG
jgi:hypothetical protein